MTDFLDVRKHFHVKLYFATLSLIGYQQQGQKSLVTDGKFQTLLTYNPYIPLKSVSKTIKKIYYFESHILFRD